MVAILEFIETEEASVTAVRYCCHKQHIGKKNTSSKKLEAPVQSQLSREVIYKLFPEQSCLVLSKLSGP